MVLKKCLVCDLVPFSVFRYGSYYIPAGVIGLRSVVELSLFHTTRRSEHVLNVKGLRLVLMASSMLESST